VPEDRRRARYVCALALVDARRDGAGVPRRAATARSSPPAGEGGFGYDPLFFVPAEDATFGEISPERKNELSHRARALHPRRWPLGPTLRRRVPGRRAVDIASLR
jgi:XTP/dITP diphosphohydrolase